MVERDLLPHHVTTINKAVKLYTMRYSIESRVSHPTIIDTVHKTRQWCRDLTIRMVLRFSFIFRFLSMAYAKVMEMEKDRNFRTRIGSNQGKRDHSSQLRPLFQQTRVWIWSKESRINDSLRLNPYIS